MTALSASIDVGDVLLVIQPYFSALFSMIVTVATPIVASKFYQWFGVKFTDAQWAVAHSAALAAAGRFWAAADSSVAKAKIDVGSPEIAAAARNALATIPSVARTIGLTPEAMASLIVSKIGLLQSGASVSDSSASEPPV
jgi:hypothetical protein